MAWRGSTASPWVPFASRGGGSDEGNASHIEVAEPKIPRPGFDMWTDTAEGDVKSALKRSGLLY